MRYHICLSKGLAVMAAALLIWGCGNANSNAPAFGVSGHPANWLDKHRPAVLAKGTTASCKECHGADLLGGIAKTSCAECHPIPLPPFAPANHADPNWVDTGLQHGAAAKARPSLTNTAINQGFKMCQSCHGADFKGGVAKQSCFQCHLPPVKVPHPEAPWLDTTGTDVTHTNTNQLNAAVCALCHTRGKNLTTPILTNYASGTPGCFNSTLCHGNISAAHDFPYPGSVHRSDASPPFTDCLVCHTNSGGVYPVSAGTPPDCRGCHKKASPDNGCGSCHGPLAGDGRPNGTAFPDVAGAHNEGDHPTFACTDCHGNAGSGQATHGPSNRTAHHDANVVIDFSVDTNFTRTGNGHGTCTSTCHDDSSEVRTW
jgi:hypothetical protein